MSRNHKSLAVAGIVLLGLALVSRAQTSETDDTGADDPNRGAARISVIQGDVNVKRGDSGDVVAAVINAPLMAKDHLQTSDGSRSEIQFDSGNLVRLAPETDLGLAVVGRARYQMQLASGTVIYRMTRDLHADIEIDTPSIAVRPRRVGIYRISVFPDGTTSVTVRDGQAEIFSPKGTQTLDARQTMLARGSSSDPEFQVETEIGNDQFDDWSMNRDRELFAASTPQGAYQQSQPEYVPPDVAGTEDLGAYGSWVPSTYGMVWAPRVAAGWAPYQYGRWVWSPYYGWTWVDYDPWGWAPFHYGRWFWNGGRGWCWWPGEIHRSYYWRPAVVGFFGFGAGGVGFGAGFGFGHVGWVALAPHEVYRPWYGRGFYGGYNRTVVNNTIIHNTNIYNTFRNARVNNSVAYVNSNNFGRGTQPFYWAGKEQLQQASLVRGQLPVTPERRSLAFSNRAPAATPQRFAATQNQRFFTHQQPAAAQRTSFVQQQHEMARFQERTLGVRPAISTSAQAPRQAPLENTNSFRGPATQQPRLNAAQGGWQRTGQTNEQSTQAPRAANTQAVRPAQQPADSAWHRFGDPGASSFTRRAPQENNNGGWHTFGAPRQEYRPQNNFQGNRGAAPQPNVQRFNEPMRMNQPIVNDRPAYAAPRYNPPQRSEQPRYEAPRNEASHYQAPRESPRYEAPRSAPSGGGHSGGGEHSGAGGGGHRR